MKRRLRLGMVGGGQGAFIGAVHRLAARMDDHYELLAAALPADGPISADQWSDALAAGVRGVADRGKAVRGDKTMLDALLPALDAFTTATTDPWAAAAEAAARGRDATVDLVARKGRASYLGERSRGTADPGATSATLLIQAAARTLT